MANFYNPNAIKDEQKTYGGNSKIIDSEVNKTAGVALKGLGDLFEGAVTTADNFFKDDIKKDWYARYDNVNERFGVDAAVDKTGGGLLPLPKAYGGTAADQPSPSPGAPVPVDPATAPDSLKRAGLAPPNLNRQENTLMRINAAHKAGRMSDTHYYLTLEAQVREMRARNPGYREYIDALVQKTTGITPANAIRRALENDLSAAQKKEEASKDDQRKRFEQAKEWMPDQIYQEGIRTGQYQKGLFIAQKNESDAKQITVRASQLDLAKKNNELNDEQAKRGLGSLIQQDLRGRMLNMLDSGVFTQIKEFSEKAEKDEKGNPKFTPEQSAIIRAGIGQLRLQQMEAVQRLLDTKQPSGKTLRELLPADEVNKLVEQNVKAELQPLEDWLNNPVSGVLGSWRAGLEAQQDRDKSKLYNHNDFSRKLITLKNTLGDAAVNHVLTAEGGGLADFAKLMRDDILTDIYTSNKPAGKIAEDVIKKIRALGKNDSPLVLRSLINTLDKALQDKELPKEMVSKFVEVFSSPEMSKELRALSPDGKTRMMEILSRGVGPRILSNENVPPAQKERYKAFVKEQFLSFANRNFADLKEDQLNNRYATIQQDPASGLVTYLPTAEGLAEARKQLIQSRHFSNDPLRNVITQTDVMEHWRTRIASGAVQTKIDDMNKNIVHVKQVLEGDKVGTKEFFQQIYDQAGLGTPRGQETGLGKFFRAIGLKGSPPDKTPAKEALKGVDTSSFTKGTEASPDFSAFDKEDVPKGDIIKLGQLFKQKGLRVAEHPEFGGVKPVHSGRSHYEGRSFDLNVGKGTVEADDPKWGPVFDKIADRLRKEGYKVLWKVPGHYGHMHVELPEEENFEPLDKTPGFRRLNKSSVDPDLPALGAQEAELWNPKLQIVSPENKGGFRKRVMSNPNIRESFRVTGTGNDLKPTREQQLEISDDILSSLKFHLQGEPLKTFPGNEIEDFTKLPPLKKEQEGEDFSEERRKVEQLYKDRQDTLIHNKKVMAEWDKAVEVALEKAKKSLGDKNPDKIKDPVLKKQVEDLLRKSIRKEYGLPN